MTEVDQDDEDCNYRVEPVEEKQIVEVTFFEKSVGDDELVLEEHLPYRKGFVVIDFDPTDGITDGEPLQFEFVVEQSLEGPGSPVYIDVEELPKRERDALKQAQTPEDAGWQVNTSQGYVIISGKVKISRVRLE